MIVVCKSGAQVVVGECLWIPGVYLSVGNARGSQGAILDPKALDRLIAELGQVRDTIAERTADKQRKKDAA